MRTRIIVSVASSGGSACSLAKGPPPPTIATSRVRRRDGADGDRHSQRVAMVESTHLADRRDVDDGKGGKVEWAMEGRAPGVLLRAGWSRSVLKPGDKVPCTTVRRKTAKGRNDRACDDGRRESPPRTRRQEISHANDAHTRPGRDGARTLRQRHTRNDAGLLRRLSSDQRIRPWRRRTRRTRRRSSRASIRSAAAATHTHRAALRWVAGPQSDCAATHARVPRKWQAMSKSRIADRRRATTPRSACHLGMPAMMNTYGMEVMQTKDKITFFSESTTRCAAVSGWTRKPTPAILDDPTYAGYLTGYWEGDTLVVETVALRDNTYIEGFTPHSDQMTIRSGSGSSSLGTSRIASR